MSSLTLLGDTSGSVILQAPAVAGSGTVTLPTVGGTIRTTTTPGSVLQIATNTVDGIITTTASGSPNDITKGAQIFSLSFTPTSATSVILVQTSTIVIGETSVNEGNVLWLALWNGSTFVAANSGTANYTSFANNLNFSYQSLNHAFTSGNTNTRIISVRGGNDGGTNTTSINGQGNSNFTGSLQRVQMTVWEIAA